MYSRRTLALVLCASVQGLDPKPQCGKLEIKSAVIKPLKDGKFYKQKAFEKEYIKCQSGYREKALKYVKCDGDKFMIKFEKDQDEQEVSESVSPCEKKQCRKLKIKSAVIKPLKDGKFYKQKAFGKGIQCRRGYRENEALKYVKCVGDKFMIKLPRQDLKEVSDSVSPCKKTCSRKSKMECMEGSAHWVWDEERQKCLSCADDDFTVMAFGSCNLQHEENHMWKAMSNWRDAKSNRVQFFLWGGDVAYAKSHKTALEHMFHLDGGDAKKPATKKDKWHADNWAAYDKFRTRMTIDGTWDDHDFGANDSDMSVDSWNKETLEAAGMKFGAGDVVDLKKIKKHKKKVLKAFLDFLKLKGALRKERMNRPQGEAYWHRDLGKKPRTVRVLSLDTRAARRTYYKHDRSKCFDPAGLHMLCLLKENMVRMDARQRDPNDPKGGLLLSAKQIQCRKAPSRSKTQERKAYRAYMTCLKPFRKATSAWKNNRKFKKDAKRECVMLSVDLRPDCPRLMSAEQLVWIRDALCSSELHYAQGVKAPCPNPKLKSEAKVHVVQSGIQFFASPPAKWAMRHGMEAWGHWDEEFWLLRRFVKQTRPSGLVFLSGDVHYAEVLEVGGNPVEVTSSGLNYTDERKTMFNVLTNQGLWGKGGQLLVKAVSVFMKKFSLGDTVQLDTKKELWEDNWGRLQVDWDKEQVVVTIHKAHPKWQWDRTLTRKFADPVWDWLDAYKTFPYQYVGR